VTAAESPRQPDMSTSDFVRLGLHVLLLSILGACAAGRAQPLAAGRHTLVHDGVTRSYVIRIPANLSARTRVPLVLVLHGGGGDAGNAERMTGFTAKANSEGFIVAYPEGTSRLGARLLTWNAGHCCGYAMTNRVRDVEFIGTLLDTLLATYPIDPARVYVTGMSNGGMMAHRLGIELSGRIAAIAPVVATVFGDERGPQHPVAALMLNGILDGSVPHKGGPPDGRFPGAWDGAPAKPALAQGEFWAAADGCDGSPETTEDAQSIRTLYRCPRGRAVELHLVKNNGHAWPGGERGSRLGDVPSPTFHATDVIWDFFKAHPK
jgi:polyhydroxybutyrate depolymerase